MAGRSVLNSVAMSQTPESMRQAMAGYVHAVHQAYLDAASGLPPAEQARLPLLAAGDVTVLAVGARNLHVIATTEALPAPQGQEVEISDALGPLAWRLRFFDPVIVPALGLVDETAEPAARADPRRARRAHGGVPPVGAAGRRPHGAPRAARRHRAGARARRRPPRLRQHRRARAGPRGPGVGDARRLRGGAAGRAAPAGSRDRPQRRRPRGDGRARRRPGRGAPCAARRPARRCARERRGARGAPPALDALERPQRRTPAQGVLPRQPRDRRHRAVAGAWASARAPRTDC